MAKAKNAAAKGNNYEEARKLRVEENKKRIEDLGILSVAKSLSERANSGKKSKVQQCLPKPKAENSEPSVLRRSSRARNQVSYLDDIDIGIPDSQKRSRSDLSSWDSYAARPLDEIKFASAEEIHRALKAAEEFQSSLPSGNPSFIKSMVRSHVYHCFWLGLPTLFCKNIFPKEDLNVTLEDENGLESSAKYLAKRVGLSGGWRAFALGHKLDAGDALVFELVKPGKFKVYIFRASTSYPSEEHGIDSVNREGSDGVKNTSKGGMKRNLNSTESLKENKGTEILKEEKGNGNVDDGLTNVQKPKLRKGMTNERMSEDVNGVKQNGKVEEVRDEKGGSPSSERPKVQSPKDQSHCVRKPRKQRAGRLFRKRAGI